MHNDSPHHAVIDTGCSANTLRADAPVTEINTNAPTQHLGTESAWLKQDNLPHTVRKAHLYPELAYKSLLLAGQFCDAGYAAVFLKYRVEIVKKENVRINGPAQIVGKQNADTDGLWVTDISQSSLATTDDHNAKEHSANSLYTLRTISNVIKYHHMCSWCPCIKTWEEAIDNGHFSGFPGLSSKNVRKYLTP